MIETNIARDCQKVRSLQIKKGGRQKGIIKASFFYHSLRLLGEAVQAVVSCSARAFYFIQKYNLCPRLRMIDQLFHKEKSSPNLNESSTVYEYLMLSSRSR